MSKKGISIKTIRRNSLLADGYCNRRYQTSEVQELNTLYKHVSGNSITLNRRLLAMLYMEQSIIQNFIRVPVLDAYRGCLKPITSQIQDIDSIKKIEHVFYKMGFFDSFIEAVIWSRLYGGGGLVIDIAGENPNLPLELKDIKNKSYIKLYAADPWELMSSYQGTYGEEKPYVDDNIMDTPFLFYGSELNRTRVIILKNTKPPSIYRARFRGWGVSSLEAVHGSFVTYLKNRQAMYKTLDKAYRGIWKMDGLADTLGSDYGLAKIQDRVADAERMSEAGDAILTDAKDDYVTSQANFEGFATLGNENRIDITAGFGMPGTKTFGLSPTGFNTGEDERENYNTSTVEGQVRTLYHTALLEVMKLSCQIAIGFVPDDLDIEYNNLKTLSAQEEEIVKTAQYNRLSDARNNGILNPRAFAEQCNHAKLLPMPIDADSLPEDFAKLDIPDAVEKIETKSIPNVSMKNSLFNTIRNKLTKDEVTKAN